MVNTCIPQVNAIHIYANTSAQKETCQPFSSDQHFKSNGVIIDEMSLGLRAPPWDRRPVCSVVMVFERASVKRGTSPTFNQCCLSWTE